MIVEILAAVQVVELAGLIGLALKSKPIPSLPIYTSTPTPPDNGVWDVFEGGIKICSVRADSSAWFHHKSAGRTFKNPATGEVR